MNADLVSLMKREALARGAELDFDGEGAGVIARDHILWRAAERIERLERALRYVHGEARKITDARAVAYEALK